jgi:hypothetical protein
MESALTISLPNLSASSMPTDVLPIPVAPQITMTRDLPVTVQPFQFSPADPVAYEWR